MSFLNITNRFSRDTIIAISLSFITGIASYVITVYTSRNLSPAGFGEYNALVSIIAMITMPFTPFFYFITDKMHHSKTEHERRRTAASFLIHFTGLAGLVVAVVVLLSGFIASNLKISAQFSMVFVELTVIFMIVTYVVSYLLIGFDRMPLYNLITYSNIPLRLLFTGLFVLLGFNLFFALLSNTLTYLIFMTLGVIFVFTRVRPHIFSVLSVAHFKLFWKDVIWAALPLVIATSLYGLSMNIDMLLVKRFLSPDDAGAYATITVLGKMLYFVPGAIMPVFYARLLKDIPRDGGRTVLFTVVLITLALVSAGLTFIVVFAQPLIVLQFTAKYASIIPLVGWYALSVLFLSITYLMYIFFIAHKRYWIVYSYAPFIVVLYFVLRARHSSLAEIVIIMLIFHAALAAYSAAAAVLLLRQKHTAHA
ncbi:MAG: oligosaccharide flippase family protein [Spirochaetes bacterium]|nr:oligosaccharide flippase family protein [Spirochaetota bacterium]